MSRDQEVSADVAVAARLGLHTVLHTDPDSTRLKLARLVPALDPHTSHRAHSA